jgi:urease accessory protein
LNLQFNCPALLAVILTLIGLDFHYFILLVTLTFNRRILDVPTTTAQVTLSLTAADRTRSRQPCTSDQGQAVFLHLPRGTALRDGDWLQAETGELAQIKAKPEPVLTVTAHHPLDLLQAAYHLGNRHVALEITPTYLRLAPDSVLQDLLTHRGLQVTLETAPFQPESGAYGHFHGTSHLGNE